MGNPQTPVVVIDPLASLQTRFALIKLGGELRLVDRHEVEEVLSGKRPGDISFYKSADANKLLTRYLETLPSATNPKWVIEQFWKNPSTHEYDSVAFSPLPLPPTTLNYWVPCPVVPIPGDASIIHTYLLSVVCDGDQNLYEYVVCFLAHMLQHPAEKPGVILVLLGGQGTGKGTFFCLLRAIWPNTFLQVSDISYVIGTFNACLERHYVVCMDEALFAGDKKAVDRLKSLVTEPVITIEQKYQPRRSIQSFHRFFAASNSNHFAQTDRDDRRFLYMRVSDAKQGDHTYFEQLHHAIEDEGVISAFVHDLFAIDLTGFNVRRRPKTQEHVAQKLQSLEGFDRFWYEILHSGMQPTKVGYDWIDPPVWTEKFFVSTEILVVTYKDYAHGLRHFRPPSAQDVANTLKKFCPQARRARYMGKRGQVRGYDLPSLEEARGAFEQTIGGKVTWSDGDWSTIENGRAEE